MSQFDKSTEKMAKQFAAEYFCYPEAEDNLADKLYLLEAGYERGAEDKLASLEVLARALVRCERFAYCYEDQDIINDAIAKVKANGDWPLEEK